MRGQRAFFNIDERRKGNYPHPCAGQFPWLPRGMGRSELERLSRDELIELVLRLQRPSEDLAHLIQAARDGPQGAARALTARRRQARSRGSQPGAERRSRAESSSIVPRRVRAAVAPACTPLFRWRFAPALPRSVGFGPVAEPLFWPGQRRCPSSLGSSRSRPPRAGAPRAPDAGAPTRRPLENVSFTALLAADVEGVIALRATLTE